MSTKWMIHPETSMVMAYNEQLVKEKNYRPYDGPLPVIDKKLGVRVMSEDTEYESGDSEGILLKMSFDKHVAQISEAMAKMPNIEFITSTGMPKISTIEKMCGFKPTIEEREAAFKEFKSLVSDKKDAEPVTA